MLFRSGIGTYNPSSKFHIHTNSTSANTSLQITDANSGFTASDGFMITKLSTNDCIIANNESANLIFQTSATEQMRITSGGNIGIGTYNPSSKFHIHTSSTTTNQSIQITDANSGFTASDGFMITKLSTNDCIIANNESANLIFQIGRAHV